MIDGANIGYYKTNYSGAPTSVDYIQIHWLVMHLLSIGHYPLLILHARHTFESVIKARTTTCISTTTHTPYSRPGTGTGTGKGSGKGSGTGSWEDTHTLKTSALSPMIDIPGIVAYWKRNQILYTTPRGSNDDWYWLYATVRLNISVITNDEMRDHHFKMLAPR